MTEFKGPVTGKLDAVAAALVFDELECADQCTAIDLREFAEFPRSDRPLRFTLGYPLGAPRRAARARREVRSD